MKYLFEQLNEMVIGKYEYKYNCGMCDEISFEWADEDPTYCGNCHNDRIHIISKDLVPLKEGKGQWREESAGSPGRTRWVYGDYDGVVDFRPDGNWWGTVKTAALDMPTQTYRWDRPTVIANTKAGWTRQNAMTWVENNIGKW